MTDRIDPSQYPNYQDIDGSGVYDNLVTTMDDNSTYPEDSLDTPESVEFNDYKGPLDIADVLRLYPELFQTRGEKLVKETRYRAVSNGINVTGKNYLLGFAVRETAGASAVFRLRDGMDSSSPIVIPVALAANESRSDYLPFNGGIRFRNGIYIEIVSGSVEGTLFTEVEKRV
jgi:hypothetical protein